MSPAAAPTDLGQLTLLVIALAVYALIRYIRWRWPEPPSRPRKRRRPPEPEPDEEPYEADDA